ncbi:MAG TPA: hypothetical protein VNJ12_09280 [Candidatus Dormibacteraeota bacterium]|nr:hypothetical protein [Candidatus Dormibacteraeota bacterium]
MNSAGSSLPTPEPPPVRMTASHKALLGIIAFLVAAKLTEMAVHIPFQNPAQQAVFSWKSLIFFVAIALLGSGFAHVVGFPGMWEKGVSRRGRIWAPLGIGIVIGVALLAIDHATGFVRLYAAAVGAPPHSLPLGASVLFQLYAAVNASILYYLFALSFTLWFFGTLVLSRHWPSQTFWVMALVVSLWEPLTMASQRHWALLRLAPVSAGLVGILVLIYTMDLAAMVLFRRFGFIAALIVRVSAMSIWHIIGRS